MSVKSSLDDEPALREHKARSTPKYLRELLDELDLRMTLRLGLPDEPPVPIGDFEAMMHLGSGGYGCVVEAWDPKLERAVALKLCVHDEPQATELLRAEARKLARLQHPNIITIHQIDRYQDNLFLVMEFAAGGSLTRRALGGEPMSWRRLVPIFADAARGLAAAHDEGIIHGDIKPSIILLHADGRPCLADFGFARIIGAPPLLPKAIGTLPYTAPEVLDGGELGPRADQWSLLVALWECLERRLPFLSNEELGARLLTLTDAGMLWLIRRWAGPSTMRSELPEALSQIFARGLSLDPRERFPNTLALAAAFDQVMAYERMLIWLESDGLLPAPVPEPVFADDDAQAPACSADTAEHVSAESVVSAKVTSPTEAASAAPPVQSSGGKATKELGLVLALVIALGGLLAQLYVTTTGDDARGPGEISTALTPPQRGEQKLLAALEVVGSVNNLGQAELGIVLELWREGWGLLQPDDQPRAAELTLTLATEIARRQPKHPLPAQLATRVAQSLEKAGEWTSAQEAQEQAVEYLETAKAPEQVWARGCLRNLEAHKPCQWR